MTKQELLTKLAMECATWSEAIGVCSRAGVDSGLMREDWLAERERLLNKPKWRSAPPRATHRAMDHNGKWFFYTAEPFRQRWGWNIKGAGNVGWEEATAIAIPAGYDWKASLEERPV